MRQLLILSFFIFLLFIISNSCIRKQEKPGVKEIVPDQTITFQKQKLFDSLVLSGMITDSIERFEDPDNIVFRTRIDDRNVAAISIRDSVLFLFQQDGRVWFQTDSLLVDDGFTSLSKTDLNGDKKTDLILYGFYNMHGHAKPYVFLSGKNGRFHYRDDIHLYNISFDTASQYVKSYYLGGARGMDSKEYYTWENDSLQLARGVQEDRSGERKIITSFYVRRNGKDSIYRSVTDNNGKVFDTALWKLIP